MNERKPLSAKYIKTMHMAAMRAVMDGAVRRKWGNSRHASPVATLALCEEIARLQIERLEMLGALKAVDKFLLVIESAVRHDAPSDLGPVTAALKAVAAVIAKAERTEPTPQPAAPSEVACND